MLPALLLAALALPTPPPPAPALPPNYEASILADRHEQAKRLTGPDSWFALVALQPLNAGDVSVGSAPGNTLQLEHGAPHAFTLRVAGATVTLLAADPSLTLAGLHPHPGATLPSGESADDALTWSGLHAYVIHRTGNQAFLRVADPNSPNLRHFHGLNFYPVNPALRLTAQYTPFTTPHEIHMGTVLGTFLTQPSPGYVTFTLDGQTIRIEATATRNGLALSFRDGTYKTTTYPAGRELTTPPPSNGLNAPGTVLLDFNQATNWPCAYTPYGTCPLPPPQNRFPTPIPAGEKRYHD